MGARGRGARTGTSRRASRRTFSAATGSGVSACSAAGYAVRVTVHRVTISEFEERITRFVPELRRAYIQGFRRAALRLERYAVEEIDSAEPYPAVDTRELRGSVSTQFVDDGAIVTVDAPHAPMMEWGTRPFRPPTAPLVEWALRKGFASTEAEARGIAFKVADKIARDGIAPRHYFTKAWARMQRDLRADIFAALANMPSAR